MAAMLCDVFNLDSEQYSEKFKGKMIVIPAGGSVKMTEHDAVNFLGQYNGCGTDESGKELFVKKLIIKRPTERPLEVKFICPVCSKEFQDQKAFDDHAKSHAGQRIPEKK
jgi:hypothetical protein